MAQQFQNGGCHNGSVTISKRTIYRYAVVNAPGKGKHYHKPRDHHVPNKHLAKEFAKLYASMILYTLDVRKRYHLAK